MLWRESSEGGSSGGAVDWKERPEVRIDSACFISLRGKEGPERVTAEKSLVYSGGADTIDHRKYG